MRINDTLGDSFHHHFTTVASLRYLDMFEPELCLIRSPFLLCIFIGFLLHSAFSSEFPLGSKLSVVDNNSWVSSNGDFALGFFNISDQPSQFRIGIRFNSKSIPFSQQTVVWVAGAHVTVGSMSYFQLTPEGELVLFDSLQGVVWTSGTANQSVVSATFRDNGNLELINREQHVVWQSFDTPSDTLVPGQSLSMYQTLRAASKQTMSSYYSLYLNGSGQLRLRWESNITYWTSDGPSIANLSACLTTTGALQLQDQSSKPVWSVFAEDHNESVNYRFLRLDLDGNLRIYSWIEALQSWRSVWQAVENQCKVFATCGQHGMCFLSASGSADCRCPFELADPNKCLVPYDEACESGINMLTYENTFLYGIYPPEDSITVSSLQHCKQLCLNDPQCTFATFSNDGSAQCSIKKTKYVTGYADPSLTSISFVKRCSGPLAVNPGLVNSRPPPKQAPALCVPCLIGAASATLFFFAIIQLGIGFWICRRRNITRKEVTLALTCPNSKGLLVLSFPEVKSLTGDFKNQIGPNMYKGALQNNHLVAVKNLNASIEERRFRSAVTKIGSIHHKNLVKLEGYCCEFNHRFLVYEYVKNGSLDKFLGDSSLCRRLTWKKRLEICSSVAKSICYLHTDCREFLSHGNLKCENVLLDENLEAKLTEFGFARVDGEASFCGSSAEKDVEDFGKLALTLLSGRQDTEDLCQWAYEQWIEGRSNDVVDKRIDGGINSEELERILRIIFWCLQMDERRRPSMGEVARVLDGILNVDLPPPPFAVQRPLLEDDDT